jgi:hypothetical protein
MATDGAASGGDEIKRILTLTGVTEKAMALIAPDAFLGSTVRKGGSVL